MEGTTDRFEPGNTSPVGIPDLVLDPEQYRAEIASPDISEDQARELLATMWSIMRLFVEFGFSYDVSGRALSEIFRHATVEPKSGEEEV